MNFFDSGSDRLTRPLDPALAAPCADARTLVELLAVESYADMGHLEGDRATRLAETERRLEASLAQPPVLEKTTPWAAADWEAAYAFAQAYRLSALYPDTVGNPETVLATLPAPTFTAIRPERPNPARHAEVFARLCARIGLDAADRAAIEAEAVEAAAKIARRRQTVGLLRAELQPDPARPPTSADAFRLFGLLFPDHPLLSGEVDVLATESCLYFAILSNDAFAKTESFLARDEAAQKAALDYLERLRKFNFYNFSHFPAFTSFEAREMAPADLDRLAAALGCERTDLITLLNTAVFIEERDQLEKYLVHDSWGHYWQADLSGLGALYDRMAALQLPLSPSDTARVGGKLLTFLDVVYLRRDGSLVLDEELARRYAAAWTHERFQPLLAPVVAELAADMIEYRARAACEAAGLALPSSSVFAHRPAKLDFAWADLSFFVKSLKRVNALYSKDAESRHGFVERARILFRLKYRRNFAAVASAEAFDQELTAILERLLALFTEVQEHHMGIKLEIETDAEGRPRINAFFQVFVNLLQIATTLNGIIGGQMEGERPHLAGGFQTLIMFLVKYFERDPLRSFWSLDETLAAYAVPLLEALAASERDTPANAY